MMLLRVLVTEILKLKRTLAMWMIFLAPFVIVLLHTLIGHFAAAQMIARHRDYAKDITQNVTLMWTVLMLPLFITLETSLLAGLEHADKNWKNLLALPAPRWTVYFSKFLVTVMMVWLAHLVIIGGVIAASHFLMWDKAGLFPNGLPLRPLLVPMAKVSAGVLLALAIQHWVSLRWHSFTAAFGFGMTAMIVGFVAINSNTWGPRIPWSMPMHLTRAHGADAWTMLAAAIGGAAAVVFLGCWEFSRRDVVN